MPSTTRRRPLPALIFIVALVLVTALVWWRVMNRNTDDDQQSACRTPSTGASAPAGAVVLPRPDSVNVIVYNSTTREGIAGDVRDELTKAGFRVPDPARNDPVKKVLTGVAQIRYPADLADAARLVQFYLPRAELKVSTSAVNRGKVIVSLGKAYKKVATATEVRAAMRRVDATFAEPTAGPSAPTSSAPAAC